MKQTLPLSPILIYTFSFLLVKSSFLRQRLKKLIDPVILMKIMKLVVAVYYQPITLLLSTPKTKDPLIFL